MNRRWNDHDRMPQRTEIRCSVEPVNRYPDFVRLARQLKRLFPEMGSERMALRGMTPDEVYSGRRKRRRRFEPRPKWPHRSDQRFANGDRFRLSVSYIEGRKQLHVIELRRAA